jgi:predicted short-subunit dehydrogenase-like oxidoreductase (DUF2520 family)
VTPQQRTRIGIIGASRLGTSLGLALERAGHPPTAVSSRRAASARAFARRLAHASALGTAALVQRCDVVVLAVPDAALGALAATLPFRRGQCVVHCSGALDLSVLEPARARGALCGCLHPLQAFPERFGAERFAGIVIGVEADARLRPWLRARCRDLGARALELAGVDRARYHAAAVLASNCVVALHAAAAQSWKLAGLPQALAREALAPLTLGAAESVRRLPLHAALTGPIARGDTATIERHLAALQHSPALRALYVQLGATLLALPLALAPARKRALQALLGRRTEEEFEPPRRRRRQEK